MTAAGHAADWHDTRGLLSGALTIRDIPRPITLQVEYLGYAADPWGGHRAVFTAVGTIDREDWGLTWNLPAPVPGGPVAGVIPPGFAGRVTLTIPATTLLDLADRPGELVGIGPIDPDPGANTLDRYQRGISRPRYPAHQRTGPLPPQGR